MPLIAHSARRIGTSDRSQLYQLARLHGIEPIYVDELGNRKIVPESSLRKLVTLLGGRAANRREIVESLKAAKQFAWTKILDDTVVVRRTAWPKTFEARLPVGSLRLSALVVSWSIRHESGPEVSSRKEAPYRVTATTRIDGRRYVKVALPFSDRLPDGYYTIHLAVQAKQKQWGATATLIVVPERCFTLRGSKEGPGKAGRSRRLWGVTVQLYGIRSARNWGIGDFRDLKDLMRWAGRDLGAAMVGVNPLHALPVGGISPYSPSSRLFHNPLYLDIEGINEFRRAPQLRRMVGSPTFQRRLERLRRSETVAYEEVWALKSSIFEKLYRLFRLRHLNRKTARASAFYRFVKHGGRNLERFAVFRALEERQSPRAGARHGWRTWPQALQDPDSEAVKKFQAEHLDRVRFYQYLEWQCDLQLKAVQTAARQSGMAIGLYKDLAVGIDPDGADAWASQQQLCTGASIGAPPDLFSPRGQNWGLSPYHPQAIRAQGYRLFTDCFRRNMRHCGLLRIDHAMGLFRLFWVPDGCDAAQGAYVWYPAEDFLGVLALESQRHGTIVVGEDLGTVTKEIRTRLMKAGLLSYRLLLFEKTPAGRFHPPHRYPDQAMSSFTTHDLPTLNGFWVARDIELKQRFGLYPHPDLVARDKTTRRQDRRFLLQALQRESLMLPHEHAATEDVLACAVYAYLARTPSQLMTIPLEDLLGDVDSPNLPGAPADAYPIWRRKAGRPDSSLEQWRRDRRVKSIAGAIRAERP